MDIKPPFMLTRRLLLLAALSGPVLSAQGQVADIFLLISPSPIMNAMGELGTALPSDDLYGIYFNPANFRPGAGLQVAYSFPARTAWLPVLDDEIGLYHQAIQIGLPALPVVGETAVGYYQTFLDLGVLPTGSGTETANTYMIADAVTIGLRRKIQITSFSGQIALGGARKIAVQNFQGGSTGGEITPDGAMSIAAQIFRGGNIGMTDTTFDLRSDNTFYDAGLLASVDWEIPYAGQNKVMVRQAFGYSLLNRGGGVSVGPGFGLDPPPTSARIGWSVSVAYLEIGGLAPLYTLTFGREVSDVLVVIGPTGDLEDWTIDYPLGDIKLGQLFRYDPKAPVVHHEGWELNVLNRIALRGGHYLSPSGLLFRKTSGVGLDLSLLVTMLAEGLGAPGLAGNIVLRYEYSTWAGGFTDDTDFHSFTLSYRSITANVPWVTQR